MSAAGPNDELPVVRAAELADLGACLTLDADSQTDHVWQMDAREEGEGKSIRFHTVRLPRVMRVAIILPPRGGCT